MSLYIPRVGGNEEYDAAAKKTPACGDGYDGLHNIMDYLVTESYETQKAAIERDQSLAPPKPGRLPRQVADTVDDEVCDELPSCCLNRGGGEIRLATSMTTSRHSIRDQSPKTTTKCVATAVAVHQVSRM